VLFHALKINVTNIEGIVQAAEQRMADQLKAFDDAFYVAERI
jgi:hypothetical protein